MPALRFIVTGRVQGVWFRGSTRARAEQLGITGYAKNLVDGSVEVVAAGAPDALEELEAWLQHGPPAAKVQRVTREALSERTLHGFLTA